tara:strand:- start:1446 stop:1877 length:432 start_codon:yes stop_codon:yes gene_type:complete
MKKNTIQDHASLALRVSIGSILLAHGLMKVLIFTIPGTVAFFGSIGFPPVIAHLTIWGEILGGIALLAGFHTRLVAILSLPILVGATWVHSGNGWVFSNEGGGWEFPALLVILTVIVVIQGSGSFALKGIPQVNSRLPGWLKS